MVVLKFLIWRFFPLFFRSFEISKGGKGEKLKEWGVFCFVYNLPDVVQQDWLRLLRWWCPRVEQSENAERHKPGAILAANDSEQLRLCLKFSHTHSYKNIRKTCPSSTTTMTIFSHCAPIHFSNPINHRKFDTKSIIKFFPLFFPGKTRPQIN